MNKAISKIAFTSGTIQSNGIVCGDKLFTLNLYNSGKLVYQCDMFESDTKKVLAKHNNISTL
jgi:hypothetical protein